MASQGAKLGPWVAGYGERTVQVANVVLLEAGPADRNKWDSWKVGGCSDYRLKPIGEKIDSSPKCDQNACFA